MNPPKYIKRLIGYLKNRWKYFLRGRTIKKLYPKGTPMRKMHIYIDLQFMAQADYEKEIENIFGNKTKQNAQ
jgi:hypothetical protein